MQRQLADTFNIDIAADLEDYLNELEDLTISFDGGKTNLNFAEAALLIQVSTDRCSGCRRGQRRVTMV